MDARLRPVPVARLTGVTAHVSAGEALPAAWTFLITLGIVPMALEPLLRGPASTAGW